MCSVRRLQLLHDLSFRFENWMEEVPRDRKRVQEGIREFFLVDLVKMNPTSNRRLVTVTLPVRKKCFYT